MLFSACYSWINPLFPCWNTNQGENLRTPESDDLQFHWHSLWLKKYGGKESVSSKFTDILHISFHYSEVGCTSPVTTPGSMSTSQSANCLVRFGPPPNFTEPNSRKLRLGQAWFPRRSWPEIGNSTAGTAAVEASPAAAGRSAGRSAGRTEPAAAGHSVLRAWQQRVRPRRRASSSPRVAHAADGANAGTTWCASSLLAHNQWHLE